MGRVADSKLTGFASSNHLTNLRSQVHQQFNAVNTRLDRVGAMGTAMAGMAGAIAVAPGAVSRVSAAVGDYRSRAALALGYSHTLPAKGALLIGGTLAGGGETGGAVGVSFGW